RQPGEPVADWREGAGISRRVRARRPPDRRLVDIDDLVEMLDSLDAVMRARMQPGAVEPARQRLVQGLDDQRRFAAARYPGDANEGAERQGDIDALQVVLARAHNPTLVAVARAARLRHGNLAEAGDVLAGEAFGMAEHVVRQSGGDDVPAMHTGSRP